MDYKDFSDGNFVQIFVNTRVDTLSNELSRPQDISSRDIQFDNGTLTVETEIDFESQEKNFLVYGSNKDADNRELAFIPIQRFDRSELGRSDLIEFKLFIEGSKRDAFRSSFPFDGGDHGAINEKSVAAVVLAVKHILEQDYIVGSTEWDRVAGFFAKNAIFVRQGSEEDIDKILSYLELYDQFSDDDAFPQVYTQFLRTLLENGYGSGREFLSKSQKIEEYIHDTLKRLFREQMAHSYRNANLVLSDYARREEYLACVTLATEIFAGFNSDFLSRLNSGSYAKKVAISSMQEGHFCRERFLAYRAIAAPGGLADAEEKKLREFVKAYVALVRRLDIADLLSFTARDRPKDVTNAFRKYEEELRELEL